MLKIGKIVNGIAVIVSIVSYGGVVAIMLLNVADVLLTKLLGRPITGAYEITEVLILCTIMASFAYAQTKKNHINMTILIKTFPEILRYFVYGLMGLISTGTAAVVGYAALQQAAGAIARGTVTSVLFIPLYPFYYVEAATMFVFALTLLYDAVLSFAAMFSRKYAQLVSAGWTAG